MTSTDGFRAITFNDILRAGGIETDVSRVKLLRHIETRNRIDVHDVWRYRRELFEAWQSRQLDDFFNAVDYVASFVVSRTGETVFVGLYAVGGSWTKVVAGTPDPMTGTPADPRVVLRELTRVPNFDVYADRLVVQWFRGGKAPGWWQWAHRNAKPVLEIATQQEAPFPGWLAFQHPVDELDNLPIGWRQTLRSTSGIYLLTDAKGMHYVGSAKGGDGLLGRWQAYRGGRSGGNLGLRGATGPYTVSVLQTVDPAMSDETIERIESLWKNKLGARTVGHNLN
ncbi:MAG: hypothetical protein Q7L55_00205 [Actinomycetota bacterium]|nr:hypothetical protein [Actinomycetota bacterium]